MTISIRTGLGLLLALMLIAAGSDQLVAQGTGPGSAEEEPPPGSQTMPTDAADANTGDRSKFQQGNVKVADGNDEGVDAAKYQSMLPYIALVAVVGIAIVIYFVKQSSAAPQGSGHGSSEPVAESVPVAESEPSAAEAVSDAEPAAAPPESDTDDGGGGFGGGGDDGGGGGDDGGGGGDDGGD